MATAPSNTDANPNRDVLDEAYDELERESPDFVARGIRWLRTPRARIVRLPSGILCIAAAFFWFLPVLGLWLLPAGLLLIAQDVPILHRPVGRMTLYLVERWRSLRRWWATRRARRTPRSPGTP